MYAKFAIVALAASAAVAAPHCRPRPTSATSLASAGPQDNAGLQDSTPTDVNTDSQHNSSASPSTTSVPANSATQDSAPSDAPSDSASQDIPNDQLFAAPQSSSITQETAAPAQTDSSVSEWQSSGGKPTETFNGDATNYDVAGASGNTPGNCGQMHYDKEAVVALNQPQWKELGGTADGNGPCGWKVLITDSQTGKTKEATVVDMCPECHKGSLDLSPSLFSTLHDGNMDAGRFSITWHFI